MRWIDLLKGERTCPCCNTPLLDLLSLAYSAPEEWEDKNSSQDNDVFHTATGDILTHDFCRIQDRHFLRTVMLLPFHDIEGCQLLGIWCIWINPVLIYFTKRIPAANKGRWTCNLDELRTSSQAIQDRMPAAFNRATGFSVPSHTPH